MTNKKIIWTELEKDKLIVAEVYNYHPTPYPTDRVYMLKRVDYSSYNLLTKIKSESEWTYTGIKFYIRDLHNQGKHNDAYYKNKLWTKNGESNSQFTKDSDIDFNAIKKEVEAIDKLLY